MTRKQKRITLVVVSGLVLASALTLVLGALNQSVTFFYSPSDLAALETLPERPIRVGGLVAAGSVVRPADNQVAFDITDEVETVTVRYDGILPDLFREGQGIVVQGRLGQDGVVVASQVLAKHDENYMPPEVAEALKKSGQWKHADPQYADPE